MVTSGAMSDMMSLLKMFHCQGQMLRVCETLLKNIIKFFDNIFEDELTFESQGVFEKDLQRKPTVIFILFYLTESHDTDLSFTSFVVQI